MSHGYVSHVGDVSPLLWVLIIRRRLVRAAPTSSSRSATCCSRRDFEAGVGLGELLDAGGKVPGSELVELLAKVLADGVLQLVALAAEPADLLADECKVGAKARRAGLRRAGQLRSWGTLLVDGGLDVFAHSVGVGEPR